MPRMQRLPLTRLSFPFVCRQGSCRGFDDAGPVSPDSPGLDVTLLCVSSTCRSWLLVPLRRHLSDWADVFI